MARTPGPILYCGDAHGEFRHIIDAATQLHASAVILLGDMEPWRPLHEELEPIVDRVWFVHGNHDTDDDVNWVRVWESKLAARNVDGRVVVLPDGTRLGGLGGVFRGAVWFPNREPHPRARNCEDLIAMTPRQDRWRDGPRRRHWSSIFPDELDRLSLLRADVLITHEAPVYHANGFAMLDTLAQAMQVKVSVHGHQHDNLDSSHRWASQGFKSHGVGLRGITAIDAEGNAEVIVEGEIDHDRTYRQAQVTPAAG